MAGIIIKLFGPMFYNMGVSEADMASYANAVSGYVTALLLALIVMIVVMIAAGKAKKSKRGLIRGQAFVAFVLVAALIVNLVSYGPLKTSLGNILNASNVSISEESRANSKEVVKKVGEEGIVLLKNESSLPLASDVKNLNVFGWASIDPIYGGSGSGSSDTTLNTGILQSLKDAGYTLNEDLSNMYKGYQEKRESLGLNMREQTWTLPEPTVDHYTDDLMAKAKQFSDTAVIVLSRSGGEGADLPMDMRAMIDGNYNIASEVSVKPENYGYFGGKYKNNGTEPDFDQGDTYLDLSNPEEDMIDLVCKNFEKVILIVNTNNPMNLSWTDNYDQIGSILYVPGAGVSGFSALGPIINGAVNPSGKTADTFVRDFTKTPWYHNIGNHSYANVNDLKEAISAADDAAEGNVSFVNYAEGIYVGYKFYETAAEEGLINYDELVMYPFGHGLSYTEFTQKINNFTDNGDSVTLDVEVKNTGSVAGKDVVEVYFTPPYTNGGIEKASVNLVEFGKTQILEPGASETISFTINKEDFASYDSSGKKIQGGGYILEKGEYIVSVREDSHTVIDEAKFTVDSDIDYSKTARTTDKIAATNQFEDYARGEFVELSRADKFANYDEACGPVDSKLYEMSDELRKAVEGEAFAFYDSTQFNKADDVMPTQGAKNGLRLFNLAGADYNDERWEKLIDQMTFEEMGKLINVGGWQTAEVKSIGKIATADCDGPAGLNNFITQVYGTSYPAELLMAQTWNKELLQQIGEGITREFKDVKYFGWYGPAVNMHRSPFAGRNFEYFSEDPVLSGKLAAAEMNGSVPNKVYAYLKHFALNDQETNRCAFLMTFASEQAIREIYLKPFEIATKEYQGKGQAMMSAFNFIGSKASCSNPHLLQNVLRGEWGFEGMVITDYNGSYGYMISDKAVRNGGDLMLGFARAKSNEFNDKSATATLAMRQACKNILYTMANSGHYAEKDPTAGLDKMTTMFITGNVICAALLIALEVFLLLAYKKRKALEDSAK